MIIDDSARLKHMLLSTEGILSFVKGKNRENLDTDRFLLSAVLRELEIINEASKHISKQTMNRFPEIPWKDMIDIRNHIMHSYCDINHNTVWNMITEVIPQISIILKKIIQNYHC